MATIRFGPFDLDSRSGELRRGGVRVRLRPQPCAVLVYLAERSGTFVSRRDLHSHLWRDGTFVHFDQGLNSCIKQVRRALGDNRRMPTYIETLPRRGYRFLVPVEVDDGAPSAAGATGGSDLLSRLARAVARELSALLPAGGIGTPEAASRRVELARVEAAARRALAATLGADRRPPAVTSNATARGDVTFGHQRRREPSNV